MRLLIMLAAVCAATLAPAFAEDADILGRWRITHGRAAPWLEAGAAGPVRADLIGAAMRFERRRVTGPAPLSCANARYNVTRVPAEGLFQGGAADDPNAAERCGLVGGPFDGVALACDTGVFEFHGADADTMLFTLDTVVWTLSRAYGARAGKSTPEAAVQAFLERHFNASMAFSPQNVSALKPLLTPGLSAAIDAYFAQPTSPDIAPVIDGDAFTDSQEYPTRFAVRKGERGRVPVDFADGYQSRRVVYRLKRAGANWRIDDLVYEHGGTLRETMKMSPGQDAR